MTTTTGPTGPQLRRERRAAEITVTAIAARMGLSRQTVHVLERDAEPRPDRVAAYREALASLRAVRVTPREEVA